MTYREIIDSLRRSYDRNTRERESYRVSPWKIEERDRFLALLQEEGKQSLLEIGAGPGHFARFFQDNGLTVVCTDLSPGMVRLCREKGLTAYEMDFLNLGFPESSFDAVFALNCLLHVPKAGLPGVLQAIRDLLKPTGLFYLGLYGGKEFEGIWEEDSYEPKRFFSCHTGAQIQRVAGGLFDLVYFRSVALEGEADLHFQSLILRRPGEAGG